MFTCIMHARHGSPGNVMGDNELVQKKETCKNSELSELH
jgi:hypothetical protein